MGHCGDGRKKEAQHPPLSKFRPTIQYSDSLRSYSLFGFPCDPFSPCAFPHSCPFKPEFGPVFSRNCNLYIGATERLAWCPLPKPRTNTKPDISASPVLLVAPTDYQPYTSINSQPLIPQKNFQFISAPNSHSQTPRPRFGPRIPTRTSRPRWVAASAAVERDKTWRTASTNDLPCAAYCGINLHWLLSAVSFVGESVQPQGFIGVGDGNLGAIRRECQVAGVGG